MEYADKATRSIVQMLQIMGVKEGETFDFQDRTGGHGLASGISSIHYISLPYGDGNSYAVLYDSDGTHLCYDLQEGKITCSIQSRLRAVFRRFVREHTEVNRKYLRTIIDMMSEYDEVLWREEQEAGRDIIRMMIEMGCQPGKDLKLTDVSRPRHKADDVYELSYNRGTHTHGSVFDLEGEVYYISYMYYTHNRWKANYDELQGWDFAAALCNRVAKKWRKMKREKKDRNEH